jgi:uncharacterized membrane protein
MSGFAPIILLGLVFGLLEILSRIGFNLPGPRTAPARMRAALAAMFVFTGAAHFYATDAFMASVPEFLPLRREAIYISGVAEFAGAIGLLIPGLYRIAGFGLALMLLVVFPANINVAVNNLQIEMFAKDAPMQWARLLVQPVFIALVLWATAEARTSLLMWLAPALLAPQRTRVRRVYRVGRSSGSGAAVAALQMRHEVGERAGVEHVRRLRPAPAGLGDRVRHIA